MSNPVPDWHNGLKEGPIGSAKSENKVHMVFSTKEFTDISINMKVSQKGSFLAITLLERA